MNVREGYTTKYKVITELLPQQDSIQFEDVFYKSEDCSRLCEDHISLIEAKETKAAIELHGNRVKDICRDKSKIWYKISTKDGKEGWASAKYLASYIDFNSPEKTPLNEETVSSEIIEHLVVKGDTAYAISKKYNISLDDLAKRNNLDASFALKLGQKLVISNKVTQAREIVEQAKSESLDAVETSKKVVINSEAEQAPVAKSENSNGLKRNVKTVKHKSFEKFGNTFAGTFSFKEACQQDPSIFNKEEYLCYEDVSGTITFDGMGNESRARAKIVIDLKKGSLELGFKKINIYGTGLDGYEKDSNAFCFNSFDSSQVDGFQKLEGGISFIVRTETSAGSRYCESLPIYFSVDYRQPDYINSLLILPIQSVVGSERFYKSKFVSWPESKRQKLQGNLKETGYYNGRTDGYWDQNLVRSTILAVLENFQKIAQTSGFSNEQMWRAWERHGLDLKYLFTDEFRAKYDYEFAVAYEDRKQKEKLRQQEEAKAREEKRKKEQAVRAENRKLAQADFDLKLKAFEEKVKTEISGNFGFRELIPGMTLSDANRVCPGLIATNKISCFGYDYKVSAKYFSNQISSKSYGSEIIQKIIKTLSTLTVDLGPLTSSYISFSKDPNDGNILNSMRNTLSKYKMDYEYTERERELFNEEEKDSLIVVYEGGKVALVIKRIETDYIPQNRLYVEYRDTEAAKQFYEKNKPKRASASDF